MKITGNFIHKPTPEQIRNLRKKLKPTKKEASLFIGGGRNSFQKYETGEIKPTNSMVNLLKVLKAKPELIYFLIRLKDPNHPYLRFACEFTQS